MKLFFVCLTFVFLWCNFLPADDGMWLPHQMADLNLKEAGLELDPSDLYRTDGTGIMSAIVYLGGGTGEFVSKDGLILTNHHVAYRAIQTSSTPAKDYLENGFIAWERSEEIPAPGYYADVLLSYEDVTEEVLESLDLNLTGAEKYKAIQRIMNSMASRVEADGPDLVCKVVPMYSGNMYYLFRYKRIKDIRMVYAPPKDLGNFGGDIDNWMWPRHTCDFTFLRAYVSPENTGIEYDPDNIPYKPHAVLKISLEGLKDGDFTFVMGYPGRTYRNFTTAELQNDIKKMKSNLRLRSEIIDFLEKAGSKSKAVEIKYASKLRSLNNGLKNYLAKLEWFQKSDVVAQKQLQEKKLTSWIGSDAGRAEKYKDVLENVSAITARIAAFDQGKEILEEFVHRNYGPALLYQAYMIGKNGSEMNKPDIDRESLFQMRNRSILRSRVMIAEQGYDLETDEQYFIFTIRRLIKNGQLPDVLQSVFPDTTVGSIANAIHEMYRSTGLTDSGYRLKLLDANLDELADMEDPLLRLGVSIVESLASGNETEHALTQDQEDARATYKSALLEMHRGAIAPDANGTLRFTYGPVKGYQPRDAVLFLPFTTLNGVIEKDTGVFPFYVPAKLKSIYKEKKFGRYEDPDHGDVVTCFLNTTNVTGGNSGSPTLNTRGEQVGIIFDMTYESVTGDYFVISELQRTISVDIRYVLFITEMFSGAGHIIDEIEL